MVAPLGEGPTPAPSSGSTRSFLARLDGAVKQLASALTGRNPAAIAKAEKTLKDDFRVSVGQHPALKVTRETNIHKLRAAVAKQLPSTASVEPLVYAAPSEPPEAKPRKMRALAGGSSESEYMHLIYRLASPGCTKNEAQLINGALFTRFGVDLLGGQYVGKGGKLEKAAKLPADADGETIFRTAENYRELVEGSPVWGPAHSTKGAFERLAKADPSAFAKALHTIYKALASLIDKLLHLLSLSPADFTYRRLQSEIKALESARAYVARLSQNIPVNEEKIPVAFRHVETPFMDLLAAAKRAKTARDLSLVQDHFLVVKQYLLTQLVFFLFDMSYTAASLSPSNKSKIENLNRLKKELGQIKISNKTRSSYVKTLEKTLKTLKANLQLP